MPSRILLVDDDPQFCKSVKTALGDRDYAVTIAADGQQAWQNFQEHSFNLILLDLMLPDIDGLDLCQQFRRDSYVPILVTSARQDQGDRMAALEVGADSYLAKPFETRELLARMAALLRRAGKYSAPLSQQAPLEIGEVHLDIAGRQLIVRGQRITVTPKEFELLRALMSRAEQVCRSEDLLWDIWGYDGNIQTRTLHVHIGRLRKKIEADPTTPQYIITQPGVGYMFAAANANRAAS